MLLLPLQIGNLTKWLKGLPLARRPLVKLNAKVAPEPAVKMLQSALPPRSKEQAAVELENVAATLLLPPTGALGWAGWAGLRLSLLATPHQKSGRCCPRLPPAYFFLFS